MDLTEWTTVKDCIASLFHKQQSRQTYINNASRRFPIFDQILVVSRCFSQFLPRHCLEDPRGDPRERGARMIDNSALFCTQCKP